MSAYVRFPEAYRRQYWRLLEALDAVPVAGSYHDDEEEARRRTTAALDVFEDLTPDQGPDLGPALCPVCGQEIGSRSPAAHAACCREPG